MTADNDVDRLELHGNGEDIKRFFSELKKKNANLSKLSGSYTQDPVTGESGLEVSFKCKMEGGDIDVMYEERASTCATIEEAEEMRLHKKMTVRVPQALFEEGKHQDVIDLGKKWFGEIGVEVKLIVTSKAELE